MPRSKSTTDPAGSATPGTAVAQHGTAGTANVTGDTPVADVSPPDAYAPPSDPAIARKLEDLGGRARRYEQQALDDVLALAQVVCEAHDECEASRVSFRGWVEAYTGLARYTANQLVQIGRQYSLLRNAAAQQAALPNSISGLAALLVAPAEVQQRVMSGAIRPTRDAIQDATRRAEQADEAKGRAEQELDATQARLAETQRQLEETVQRLREADSRAEEAIRTAQAEGRAAVEQELAQEHDRLDERERRLKAEQQALEAKSAKLEAQLKAAADRAGVRDLWNKVADKLEAVIGDALLKMPNDQAFASVFVDADWVHLDNLLAEVERLRDRLFLARRTHRYVDAAVESVSEPTPVEETVD